ncbi:MAG TPA: glycogen-binding domain-containing protein [Gemmatimonadaceae bacterium]|nr:glycogen-binding domain-containing protein [Gemmatimonadaceae bacterium]
MTDDLNRDEAFAEQIAAPLRAEVSADASFEARVMSAVHAIVRAEAEAADRHRNRSWWLRPFTVRLTPVLSLAAAAGVVALLAVEGALLRRPEASSVSSARSAGSAAVDTVHVVRFVFVDPSARSVALVGTFNAWQKGRTPLRLTRVDGVWSVSVPLSVGRHEYAFVVSDGKTERWVADPTTESQMDDFGTESSVIAVRNDSAL